MYKKEEKKKRSVDDALALIYTDGADWLLRLDDDVAPASLVCFFSSPINASSNLIGAEFYSSSFCWRSFLLDYVAFPFFFFSLFHMLIFSFISPFSLLSFIISYSLITRRKRSGG